MLGQRNVRVIDKQGELLYAVGRQGMSDARNQGQDEGALAQVFNSRSLLVFALPSVLMSVCSSLYTIVDGFFIARYAGTMALSGLSMFWPAWSVEYGLAIMLAAGGSAMIAKNMGEGRYRLARSRFSGLMLLMLALGVLVAVVGNVWCVEINRALGASEAQLPYAVDYARVHFSFGPCLFMQAAAGVFFVTAGRPSLGLISTCVAGVLNMVLDYVFMVELGMGITGASLATGIGWAVPTLVFAVYFMRQSGPLYLTRPRLKLRALCRICSNGMSEMVTHLAVFVNGVLFNVSFMRYAGEAGVAALAVVFYFEYLFTAVYFGYSTGVAPIVSFKYGHDDQRQLRFVTRRNLQTLIAISLVAYALSMLTLPYTLPIFVDVGTRVYELAEHGFVLYACSFLLAEVNIYTSAHFTALSNGPVSAIISGGRSFVFMVASILLLPLVLGIDGLWLSVPVAELLGVVLSVWYLLRLRKRYGY